MNYSRQEINWKWSNYSIYSSSVSEHQSTESKRFQHRHTRFVPLQ